VIEHPIQRVGLIGWPVEHSISPAMHNAAFAALGLGWHYDVLPTPPGKLESTLDELKAQGYRGANVTVPHKEAVLRYLDEIDACARAIGAVNTIVAQEGRLVGHNTDAGGFLAALRAAGFEPSGRRALLLGAGGAARAVIYALAGVGCTVAIYNRTPSRAFELVRHMGEIGVGTPAAWLPSLEVLSEPELGGFDLLVNATPLGMWSHTGAAATQSAWPGALPFPSRWTVFDLVYNPAETRLLAQARAAGATAIGGLGMLVHQGALAFELWTGYAPPLDVMHAAAREALASR
jgi:shikimate dehydrogenase